MQKLEPELGPTNAGGEIAQNFRKFALGNLSSHKPNCEDAR